MFTFLNVLMVSRSEFSGYGGYGKRRYADVHLMNKCG